MTHNPGVAVPFASALAAAVADLPRVLRVPGRLVTAVFRDRACTAIAEVGTQLARPPLTDIVALELASGAAENTAWTRPIRLHAVVEAGCGPARVLARASRWASYAARVAVLPDDRITDTVLLEAALRGIWVVAAGGSTRVRLVGEDGPVAGSSRGLQHRLLDEIVAAGLTGALTQDD